MGNWWRTGQNGMSGKTQLERHLQLPLCPSSWSRLLFWPWAHSANPPREASNFTTRNVCARVRAPVCYNTSVCAVVDMCLCSLSVYSLERCRCHMHSQVSMCLGAYVHRGSWKQVEPGAHDTEKEILRNGQGPADIMISGNLGRR